MQTLRSKFATRDASGGSKFPLWFEPSDPGKHCPPVVAGSASTPEPPAHAPPKDLAVFLPPRRPPRGSMSFALHLFSDLLGLNLRLYHIIEEQLPSRIRIFSQKQ